MRKALWIGSLVLAVIATTAFGDLLQTLGQYATITIDDSRADWAGLTSFNSDSDDIPTSGDVDWNDITIAHDGANLYVRYEPYDGPGWGSAWRYHVLLDTDQNRNTGYIGGSSQFAIGADYMIEGATVFQFTSGNQNDWGGWSSVGSGSSDENPSDIELGISQSLVGSPASFYFIVWGDNSGGGGTDDAHPDGGLSGAGGDYFQYAIPEPLTASLIGLGLLVVLRMRRR